MSDRSKIAWCDATWNPVVGCSPAGVGCVHCYASAFAARLARMPATSDLYRSVTTGKGWNGATSVAGIETWGKPRSWKKPRRIFVGSMGDLFHETVKTSTIDNVDRVMRGCPQHTFLLLTKRFERICDYTQREPFPWNVWCGMSASTQTECDRAVLALRGTATRIRWLSLEPLVGPIVLKGFDAIDWVVVGAESGPSRRPCNDEWIWAIVRQCSENSIPCFLKQTHVLNGRVSRDPNEWPEDLRVRQYPEPR
jgi:protein gp37